MRRFLRFIGLFLAAGAFVAVVVDGTRSIANSRLDMSALGTVWRELAPSSVDAARLHFESIFSPALWTSVAERCLATPLSVLLIILAAVCLFFGRRPRSRIGYRSDG